MKVHQWLLHFLLQLVLPHDSRRDLVLVLTIHERAVQHTAGRVTSDRGGWITDASRPAAPAWLVSWFDPRSRSIELQTPSALGHFIHSCHYPAGPGRASFLIKTERAIYKLSFFSSCCCLGARSKISQKNSWTWTRLSSELPSACFVPCGAKEPC